jgi:hypothetical protein
VSMPAWFRASLRISGILLSYCPLIGLVKVATSGATMFSFEGLARCSVSWSHTYATSCAGLLCAKQPVDLGVWSLACIGPRCGILPQLRDLAQDCCFFGVGTCVSSKRESAWARNLVIHLSPQGPPAERAWKNNVSGCGNVSISVFTKTGPSSTAGNEITETIMQGDLRLVAAMIAIIMSFSFPATMAHSSHEQRCPAGYWQMDSLCFNSITGDVTVPGSVQ